MCQRLGVGICIFRSIVTSIYSWEVLAFVLLPSCQIKRGMNLLVQFEIIRPGNKKPNECSIVVEQAGNAFWTNTTHAFGTSMHILYVCTTKGRSSYQIPSEWSDVENQHIIFRTRLRTFHDKFLWHVLLGRVADSIWWHIYRTRWNIIAQL